MRKILVTLLTLLLLTGNTFYTTSYAASQDKVLFKKMVLKKSELEKTSKGKSYVKTLNSFFEKHKSDTEKLKEIQARIQKALPKLGTSKKQKEMKVLLEYIDFKIRFLLPVHKAKDKSISQLEKILNMSEKKLVESTADEVFWDMDPEAIVKEWIREWVIDASFVENIIQDFLNNWKNKEQWYRWVIFISYFQKNINLNVKIPENTPYNIIDEWYTYYLIWRDEEMLEDWFKKQKTEFYSYTYEEKKKKVENDLKQIYTKIQEKTSQWLLSLDDIIEKKDYKLDKGIKWTRYLWRVNYESLSLDRDKFNSPWWDYLMAIVSTESWKEMFQIIAFTQKDWVETVSILWNYEPEDSKYPVSLFKTYKTWKFLKDWDKY